MMNPLALRSQRLPACRQNVNLRSFAENALGQSRYGPDDVLAAVQHQQRSLFPKEGKDDRQGIVRNYGDAKF
jgi:hypothetical protein